MPEDVRQLYLRLTQKAFLDANCVSWFCTLPQTGSTNLLIWVCLFPAVGNTWLVKNIKYLCIFLTLIFIFIWIQFDQLTNGELIQLLFLKTIELSINTDGGQWVILGAIYMFSVVWWIKKGSILQYISVLPYWTYWKRRPSTR